MANRRMTMRKIREIFRLRYEAERSIRQISLSVGISVGAIQKLLEKAAQAQVSWPLPERMGDAALSKLLYPGERFGVRGDLQLPDWNRIQRRSAPRQSVPHGSDRRWLDTADTSAARLPSTGRLTASCFPGTVAEHPVSIQHCSDRARCPVSEAASQRFWHVHKWFYYRYRGVAEASGRTPQDRNPRNLTEQPAAWISRPGPPGNPQTF